MQISTMCTQAGIMLGLRGFGLRLGKLGFRIQGSGSRVGDPTP